MIYGLPGTLFQADYRFYKQNKMFNFPKNKLSYRILRLLLKSNKVRKATYKRLQKITSEPFVKFIDTFDIDKEKFVLGI